MKTPLIKIDEDIPIEKSYVGRYKNPDGTAMHGIYLRKYKHNTEKLFINNGYLMRLYKYPNIEPLFYSPMVNDYNLHLCGGWSFRGVHRKEAITRVINGAKPMGFLVTTEVEEWEQVCIGSGLSYQIVPNHIPTENHFDIGISCGGTFAENFNLQNLNDDYTNYFHKIDYPWLIENVNNFILQLGDKLVSSYLDSDYANPYTIEELMVTGLILGYPIETTVAVA